MKKALIIGASGFVGDYLIQELVLKWKMQVFATKRLHKQWSTDLARVYNLDILNREDIADLLFEIRPDFIFLLAAQSSVSAAWENPGMTIDINIKGSSNVMEAIRGLPYNPRVLLIGSGEEYGYVAPEETPIREENALRPGNIYAATKVCQSMMGNIYSKAYDIPIVMARAFNHIGPGQSSLFVVSDFCKQVVEIEKGLREPVMKVGNLAAKRDFTDVRDVVKAYTKLIQIGQPGEVYNVGSGHAIAIQELLKLIVKKSSTTITVEVDRAKIRPIDIPIIEADITKIHNLTGWKPEISLEQTLQDTLDYWRKQL